ncbi:hypothetical protein [Haemophilus sp.]
MKNLIEITQDGCCVLDINSPEVQGFFTKGIESCVVYVIRTNSNWIAIHDSGQLDIKKLRKSLKEFGKIQTVSVFFGILKIETYQERNKKFRELLDFNGRIREFLIPECHFDLSVWFDGLNTKYLKGLSSEKLNFIGMPDISRVNGIIKLNNAFIPLGSQSLEVDIQYKNGEYQNKTKLRYTIEYMLERTKKEDRYIDINRSILEEAEKLGIIKLTDEDKELLNNL